MQGCPRRAAFARLGRRAAGNRLSSAGLTPYQYNNSNQLTSTPNATFTYDDNGNTLTKTDTNGVTAYTWDYENRLTSVTLPGSAGTVMFTYDPFGRRIQKSGPAGVTNYFYDGANVVTDLDAGGAVLATYAQGAGIDEPLASNSSAGTAFFEADGLGSVTSLSDLTGITDTYTYDAFGVTTATGATPNRFRYTGREWDSETGLYYYRARYYDSSTGRFLTEDPIRFASGQSNHYVYVRNNPVKLVDPSGKASASWIHSNETYQAAIAAGYSPGEAAALADGVEDVDFRPGSQGTDPDATHQHAMGGRKHNGQYESCAEAYANTVQQLRDDMISGDVTGAIHLIQDSYAGGHEYSSWDGGWTSLHIPGVSHILKDLHHSDAAQAATQLYLWARKHGVPYAPAEMYMAPKRCDCK